MALTYSLAVVLVLLMIIEFLRLKSNNFRVNTSQAIQLINREQAIVVDLRSPELFRKGHIIDSQSLTPKEIQNNPKKIEREANHKK
jgi:rhodanese-related sulfurtransferase